MRQRVFPGAATFQNEETWKGDEEDRPVPVPPGDA
jgi:hypothetical protein